MHFGICADSINVDTVRKLGYDFIELGVAELGAESSVEAFVSVRDRVLESDIKAEAFNTSFPQGMMLVGPQVDLPRVKNYVGVALARSAELGGKIIVWGSPHARRIPDGFSRERAFEQLTEVGGFVGQVAAKYALVVVVEPLDAKTTNTIGTVPDGYDLARRIKSPVPQDDGGHLPDVYEQRTAGQ